MSVDGSSEVCEAMVEQDVMTPLVALLSKVILTHAQYIPCSYCCSYFKNILFSNNM